MQPDTAPIEDNNLPKPTSYPEARERLVGTVRLELVGPDNSVDGEALIHEELTHESPLQKYKAGVLYPKTKDSQETEDLEKDAASTAELPQGSEESSKLMSKSAEESLEEILSRPVSEELQEDNNLSDLAYSGLQRPASVAISFFIPKEAKKDSLLKFSFSCGVYRKIEGRGYVREPLLIEARKPLSELFSKQGSILLEPSSHATILNINLKIFVRQYRNKGILVTYSAINETPMTFNSKRLNNDMRSAFQVRLKVELQEKTGEKDFGISAYPKPENRANDQEEQSLDLLYRNAETYAVGHGCSAVWPDAPKKGFVHEVWSTAFPEFEIYSITPYLKRKDGSRITVSMADLAGIKNEAAGFAAIDELIQLYGVWIGEKREEIKNLDPSFHSAANKNLDLCEECLLRIKQGRKYLEEDKKARLAFRLANEAILIQQKRASDTWRELHISDTSRISFDKPFQDMPAVLSRADDGKGNWHPFQIAFLLLSLKSAASGDAPDREVVDLIWFPTGGGKTEAYFGLTAFSIFYRRLVDPEDAGVSTIMRYTLRLLTADQFERASGLICALEYLRRKNAENLGDIPFTIGIWLGDSTTPNKREGARNNLKKLSGEKTSNKFEKEGNKFLVTKCPWCAAQIGPIRAGKKVNVIGYSQEGNRVKIHCSDTRCDFHENLPIYVVDEDIYEFRPTLIIGTVDKFAQLAWDDSCRRIFGFGSDGQREVSPPGLIIQDELHLISGPLGSMVGLYETLIEELCTDYRGGNPIRPKIVCSTATIRRFETQVQALYGRSNAKLFPASGIEAEDSFFAKWQSHEEQKGRKYVGIYAPGESIQTMQVRTMAIALQGALTLPPSFRDPWWTLLSFFNSLRELGNTITLFQSDILTRLKFLRRREDLDWSQIRKLNNPIIELTSRLKNDEIDGVRAALKTEYKPDDKYNNNVIDVCLASNIIEVGVDIRRLSLMTIVGQPKTTAQYIQVSGRVGRDSRKPGLVLTIYGASKPRDRSHFEKFRTYHERLYAQVEPTSVTPFSGPVLERGLHALIVGYLRQTLPESRLGSAWPIPPEVSTILQKIEDRVRRVYRNPEDQEYVLKDVEEYKRKFMDKWEGNQTFRWDTKENQDGLLYRAGAHVTKAVADRSSKTLQSMRNVDLECKGEIAYAPQRRNEA